MSAEFVDWWFKSQMGSAGVSSPAAYAALCEQWLFRKPPLPAEVDAMVACAIQTPLYGAREMSTPVLIMQGRHDRKQRYSGAVHFASLLRNARLETFEDSAHMPHVDEMQRFNQVLADFARQAGR